jgi:hypothetical protein
MSTRAKEYLWVLLVSALILSFGTLPIIAGYASQTPSQRFIGAYFDRQDYAVHMAAMHFGEQGNWLYQIRFTSESEPATFLKTFYVVLGHISRWTGGETAAVYQVARLLFGLLACLSVYRLLERVFPSVYHRRLAFVLAILGSGFGWFQTLFGLLPAKITPIDLWMIGPYPLFSFSIFPQYSAVLTALATAITAFLDYNWQRRWQNIALIGVCAIFVQVVDPVVFILADVAMAGVFIFWCWRKRSVDFALALALALIALVQIPLMLYSYIFLTRDPGWAVFTTQNVTLSPPPVYLLLGFGLFWPFAIYGALRALRKQDANLGWAVFWLVAGFGLAYLPVNVQRRFTFTITLPLAVLATPILSDFSEWLHIRLRLSRYTGAVLFTGLASISTFLLVGYYTIDMTHRSSTLFEPTALVQAVDWLAKNGTPDEVVLASESTSQLVAIRTPLRLYFGHEMETLHYDEKSQAVERFYRGEQPDGWLEAQGITWVIFGPHETEWRQTPLGAAGLEIAYQNNLVTIYRITHP